MNKNICIFSYNETRVKQTFMTNFGAYFFFYEVLLKTIQGGGNFSKRIV
jgi:hypothetical protein